MNMTNTITISGFDGSIAYCEAKGLSKVFMAYANECSRAEIMEVGFNPNSGYVYIALEDERGIPFVATYYDGQWHCSHTDQRLDVVYWMPIPITPDE